MNHPDELLADYVDGTLSGRDLETVRSHLASCRRCREETTLAGEGRRAVASMPAPVAPRGLGDAAIREAAAARPSVRQPHGRQLPTWYRWAGVAAAAAAVVLVAVLVLPGVGQGPNGAGTADRAAGTVAPTAPTLEVQHVNYDLASLRALGVSVGEETTASPQAPTAEHAGTALPAATLAPAATQDALACVREAWPTLTQDPVRLIAARFEGKPAYLAVYLQGPGAGEPPDLLTITVTSAGSCRFVTTFAHRLG